MYNKEGLQIGMIDRPRINDDALRRLIQGDDQKPKEEETKTKEPTPSKEKDEDKKNAKQFLFSIPEYHTIFADGSFRLQPTKIIDPDPEPEKKPEEEPKPGETSKEKPNEKKEPEQILPPIVFLAYIQAISSEAA
jgi:hypothetical protein